MPGCMQTAQRECRSEWAVGLSSLHRVWQYLQGIAQKVSWKGKHREGRFLCSSCFLEDTNEPASIWEEFWERKGKGACLLQSALRAEDCGRANGNFLLQLCQARGKRVSSCITLNQLLLRRGGAEDHI